MGKRVNLVDIGVTKPDNYPGRDGVYMDDNDGGRSVTYVPNRRVIVEPVRQNVIVIRRHDKGWHKGQRWR